MDKPTEIEEREANHGEKMVEVKLRFWTNKLADAPGHVIPKHAWAAGVVRMERNASHGIEPGKPVPFHTLLDLGTAIEECLVDHGVVLHTPDRMRRYWSD